MKPTPIGVEEGVRGRELEEVQQMAFDFDFFMPIHDASTSSQDQNRFPVIGSISNDPTSNAGPPRPNGLATANFDVQNYIMAFLPTADLSALMRTCRYFLDACVLALCRHSNDLHFDPKLTRLPSFRRFLRINAGPSSRAHLVKELWIGASGFLQPKYRHESVFISKREQWSAAFLDVLRHCRNVRRVEIHSWFVQDISYPLLLNTISSTFSQLEDLTILIPFIVDTDSLRILARLPLRNFAFLKYPLGVQNQTYTYASIDTLPRSLTQLDVHRSPSRTETPFRAVQKLGIRETASRMFVADVTTAFPNVSHLVLWRPDMNDLAPDDPHNRALLEDAREHNKTHWESSRYRDAWPSISAIWAEDSSVLYALGLAKRVASISLRIHNLFREIEEEYIQPVLADTSPSFLEVRIYMDSFVYLYDDWSEVFGPSVRRLTLLLYAKDATGGNKSRMGGMLNCAAGMLAGLLSVTHLLLRFAMTPREPGSELYMYQDCPSSNEVQILHSVIQSHLCILATRSKSVHWIGYEVYGWGIKSWDVFRSNGRVSASDPDLGGDPVTCRFKFSERGELESVATAKREGMDVFKDVRPILQLTF